MDKIFKRCMIGLISLAVLLILVMFFSHMYVICKTSIHAGDEIVQDLNGIIQTLISMQSITLAVTGISVTVVSIVVSLISIYREKKIEEADRLVESLKQELTNIKDDTRKKQEKLNENLKKMINLLALQASEFSAQYFDNISSCIDSIEVDELEDTIKTQMSFVMVNTIEKIYDVSNIEVRIKHKDTLNREAYEKIIKYSKYMLQDKNLNKEYYNFAILKYAFYLYELARLEERIDINRAKQYLYEAYGLIGELQKMKDTNGYIHYLCGIISLWLGKTDSAKFPDGQLRKFNEALIFFNEALTHDQNFRFSNNKAVALMNIAYVHKRQGNKNLAIENLLCAKKELKDALHYNKKYHLLYNNLANINRNLLEITIGIKFFYEDYLNISFNGLNEEEIKSVNNYMKESYDYLNQSIKIEPNFIDNYYNIATFYLYNYLLENKKNKKYIENAKTMLRKAEAINPQARKMLKIKEIIYQLA